MIPSCFDAFYFWLLTFALRELFTEVRHKGVKPKNGNVARCLSEKLFEKGFVF